MSLRNILLLVKDCSKTCQFFKDVVNLSVVHESSAFIELNSSNNRRPIVPIILKEAPGAAQLSTGYSPYLTFEIDDMETSVTAAIKLGGVLDGQIKYPAQGKFAAVRTPDGHMIGLFQSAI